MVEKSQSTQADVTTGKMSWVKNPAAIIIVLIVVVGVWFGSSFINTATHPTTENSLNYNGMAEVVAIIPTTTKCFVNIRREDGTVTKQSMSKDTCSQIREGQTIKIVNGQYQP